MQGDLQAALLDAPSIAVENGWSRMIEQVTVNNFRCFADLKVSDLKRINILVGRNSSGKSAFIESLFLSSASTAPTLVFTMRAIRRIGGAIQVPADSHAYRNLWEDLFYDFDTHRKIFIQARGSGGIQRSLGIHFKESSQQELVFGKDAPTTVGFPQVVFNWRRGNGKEIVIKPVVTTTGLQLGTIAVDHFPMIWFTPGSGDTAEETARRFSTLSRRNHIEPIIAAMKAEFEFIESFSIEFLAGIPMVFASIKGQSAKLPLGLVSDGVNRLLAILVGIAYYAGGVVLIDQLEDGIYYERFPSIWKTLHSFSGRYKTQLFISTHSSECVKGAREAINGNEENFRLLRATRMDNGGCTVESIRGDFFESALEQDFEVR